MEEIEESGNGTGRIDVCPDNEQNTESFGVVEIVEARGGHNAKLQ